MNATKRYVGGRSTANRVSPDCWSSNLQPFYITVCRLKKCHICGPGSCRYRAAFIYNICIGACCSVHSLLWVCRVYFCTILPACLTDYRLEHSTHQQWQTKVRRKLLFCVRLIDLSTFALNLMKNLQFVGGIAVLASLNQPRECLYSTCCLCWCHPIEGLPGFISYDSEHWIWVSPYLGNNFPPISSPNNRLMNPTPRQFCETVFKHARPTSRTLRPFNNQTTSIIESS